MSDLESRLKEILQEVSAEQKCHTPDFILAEYLMDCLNAFNKCTKRRAAWYRYYGRGLPASGYTVSEREHYNEVQF